MEVWQESVFKDFKRDSNVSLENKSLAVNVRKGHGPSFIPQSARMFWRLPFFYRKQKSFSKHYISLAICSLFSTWSGSPWHILTLGVEVDGVFKRKTRQLTSYLLCFSPALSRGCCCLAAAAGWVQTDTLSLSWTWTSDWDRRSCSGHPATEFMRWFSQKCALPRNITEVKYRYLSLNY